ncbi:MAG: branched-chain amino acid transport system substrate-binding protein [Burkholderiales bacterium]|nr:branched-chain amino acid transporter system, substrate-binding protein [Burkholderia sp.]
MNKHDKQGLDRRGFLMGAATIAGAAATGTLVPAGMARAQTNKIKVGLMLPSTGSFAQIGNSVANGFKMYVDERGGKLGGREIEYYTVDDESNPSKAPENASRLVQRDKVDVVIGSVHSGVALGMARVLRQSGVLSIVPAAGADEITGALCAPNIFRTSFSNWQIIHPLGKVLKDKGHKKVVFITWKFTTGDQMLAAFKEGFEQQGGQIIKELSLPFPQVEFQSLLTEIGALKPDAVVAFFAGAGAAKFIKDYQAAGLKDKIPLFGSGLLTDGVLDAVGDAAQGIETTLHYADGLDTPADKAFRLAYAKKYKEQPDVYSVQGYDAGQLLAAGLDTVKGDVANKAGMIKAMESARINSPRGAFTLSRAHNPVQDSYLRKVVGKENKLVSVVQKALADPARGCRV